MVRNSLNNTMMIKAIISNSMIDNIDLQIGGHLFPHLMVTITTINIIT